MSRSLSLWRGAVSRTSRGTTLPDAGVRVACGSPQRGRRADRRNLTRCRAPVAGAARAGRAVRR